MVTNQARKTGILNHISSLPGSYGIGDMGAAAREFADILAQAGCRAWQILPISPTIGACAHSPYSGPSVFAGNTDLCDPEWFIKENLLDEQSVVRYRVKPTSETDFDLAKKIRDELFEEAYNNFRRNDAYKTTYRKLSDEFWDFCVKKGYWLEDYALFMTLKDTLGDVSWTEWPREYSHRDWTVLDPFKSKPNVAKKIDLYRFSQFVFFKQLGELREYCNELDIELIGDLPIYVAHDSADVWGHRELFELDGDGNPTLVAGVPPDYYSKTGQRWGNPIYRWSKMREDGYYWWLGRFRHCLLNLDRVRIDHFRGFLGYWGIPADEKTAVNGKWHPGPGREFFHALRYCFANEENGVMPFIAEDLGVITDDVHAVMEDFKLPGMKVLQFAFGEGMPQNPYVPHHHRRRSVVYVGTHDNNTTIGWYENEATKTEKENLRAYADSPKLPDAKSAKETLVRMALSSTAELAVLTVQDVLSLKADARMNTPSTVVGNWLWRMTEFDTLKAEIKGLRSANIIYDRFRPRPEEENEREANQSCNLKE